MIVSETAQAILNVIDHGLDAEEAVSSPRIHAQWIPDGMLAEPEIPEDVRKNLEKRGHKLRQAPPSIAFARLRAAA